MKIERHSLGIIGANCYLVYDEASKDALVIDPGDEFEILNMEIEALDLKVKNVFLTHAHYDHFGALDDLIKATKANLYYHEYDDELAKDAQKNCSLLTVRKAKTIASEPTELLLDGDVIDCGFCKVEVIHTPGHTPGSVCYKIGGDLFTGDTLFHLTMGRCDFYGGSNESMKASLSRLAAIDEDLAVHPGHSVESTLFFEKEHNIYMKHLIKENENNGL